MNGATQPMTPPAFALRPASETDFDFARCLYLGSMQPLLTALDAWDADEIETAFRGYFIPAEIQVVTLGGKDVGWVQVSNTPDVLSLDQVHLIEAIRVRGIGTAQNQRIIAAARNQGRNVTLSLVRGNPALTLYRRLGFRRTSEDDTKIHMRYDTDA